MAIQSDPFILIPGKDALPVIGPLETVTKDNEEITAISNNIVRSAVVCLDFV